MALMTFTCITPAQFSKHQRCNWSFRISRLSAESIKLFLCVFVFVALSDHRWEATIVRDDEAQTQTPEKEEKEGPQWAHQACVSLRPVLQRHSGGHQGTEPQRHLWRCVQDRGFHVGRTGRGAKTGTFHITDLQTLKTQTEVLTNATLFSGHTLQINCGSGGTACGPVNTGLPYWLPPSLSCVEESLMGCGTETQVVPDYHVATLHCVWSKLQATALWMKAL